MFAIITDKSSSGGGAPATGATGPTAGASGGPMGLGGLFAGGMPKLRPVGSTGRDRSPSPGECACAVLHLIHFDICKFLISMLCGLVSGSFLMPVYTSVSHWYQTDHVLCHLAEL